MTEQIFFTSDTHFGHAKLLGLGEGRPFSSIEEHDETLIERWNERVNPLDVIYFLGDFSFLNRAKTNEVISRLQGQIHFIRGNHDKSMDRHADRFASFQDYKVITIKGQKIILFHFPIRSWWHVGQGSWHLFGHCHNNLPDDGKMASMDVGVDAHGFAPISLEEIAVVLSRRHGRPGDHHGAN